MFYQFFFIYTRNIQITIDTLCIKTYNNKYQLQHITLNCIEFDIDIKFKILPKNALFSIICYEFRIFNSNYNNKTYKFLNDSFKPKTKSVANALIVYKKI